VVGSLTYSLVRVLLDVLATSHGDQARLQAEVLALRRQPGSREANQAGALEPRRSDGSGGPARKHSEIGLGRLAGQARDGARLAPHVGAKEVGELSRPTAPWPPPISAECRQLIVRMARENPRWGYFRIRVELLKLGHQVAATTIRSVLLAAGVPPSGRRSQLTWKQFLSAHAETLVAADFFSVDTIFFKRLYVLIYLHLASRRVLLASCTSKPNAAWVTQQARNLTWKLEDEGIKLSDVIHDRDKKFAFQADRVFHSQGARVILTPLMAPRANAYAERWIGSCRRECLDWILVFNQRHLQAVIDEYRLHYNDERPHRSRNLRPPASCSARVQVVGGQIERRTRLGGLLSDYRQLPVAA